MLYYGKLLWKVKAKRRLISADSGQSKSKRDCKKALYVSIKGSIQAFLQFGQVVIYGVSHTMRQVSYWHLDVSRQILTKFYLKIGNTNCVGRQHFMIMCFFRKLVKVMEDLVLGALPNIKIRD